MRTMSPATFRRYRRIEIFIVAVVAAFALWLVVHSPVDDSVPTSIDIVTDNPETIQCPAGYDGPDEVSDRVFRCTLNQYAGVK